MPTSIAGVGLGQAVSNREGRLMGVERGREIALVAQRVADVDGFIPASDRFGSRAPGVLPTPWAFAFSMLQLMFETLAIDLPN